MTEKTESKYVTFHDVSTGKVITRELTPEEIQDLDLGTAPQLVEQAPSP